MNTKTKTTKKVMTPEQLDELIAAKENLTIAQVDVGECKGEAQKEKSEVLAATRRLRVIEQRLQQRKKNVVKARKKLDKLTQKYKGWSKPKPAQSDPRVVATDMPLPPPDGYSSAPIDGTQ